MEDMTEVERLRRVSRWRWPEMTCTTCGIAVRPFAGTFIHAEPRTLENNLHNGTRDHNATT